MRYILLFSVFCLGCGRYDAVASGSTEHKVTITLGFIEQIEELCTDALLDTEFTTANARKAAIAKCVFNNLSTMGNIPDILAICNKAELSVEESLVCSKAGVLH